MHDFAVDKRYSKFSFCGDYQVSIGFKGKRRKWVRKFFWNIFLLESMPGLDSLFQFSTGVLLHVNELMSVAVSVILQRLSIFVIV